MKEIWIVDDNADSRILARAILGVDYELVELESGQQALDLLENARPDLLLLDISMPDVNGFDVLCELRSRPELAHVPVVAYTARASVPERNGIMALGFDRCVVKPVLDERQLLGPIAELLDAVADAA
jgi:CheY-like chemotaxis protein